MCQASVTGLDWLRDRVRQIVRPRSFDSRRALRVLQVSEAGVRTSLTRKNSRNWLMLPSRARSLLRFQFALVLGDERADLVRHVEQLRPLLLIEGDRESPQPVD